MDMAMLLGQVRPGAPEAGAVLGGMLCGLVVGVAIGTLVGAIILRCACWLYNKMVGGPGSEASVPDPSFGQAMAIAFVTMLVQFGLGLVLGIAGLAAQMPPGAVNLISIPLSYLASAAMITAMLPTTFPKGLLVALLYIVICIVLAVVIAVFVALVLGGLMLGLGR